jgi:hypothetical protein
MCQQYVCVYTYITSTDHSVYGAALAICVCLRSQYLQDSSGAQLTAGQPAAASENAAISIELQAKKALKNQKRKALRHKQREKLGAAGVGSTVKAQHARSSRYKSMLQVCTRALNRVLRSSGKN